MTAAARRAEHDLRDARGASMAFADELVRSHPGKVEVRVSAEGSRLDPGRLVLDL